MMVIALAITYLNYQHATNCAGSGDSKSDGKEKDMKLFLESLNRRLLEAESQNIHNARILDNIIDKLQHKVFHMEETELQDLRKASREEAVRIALRLSAQSLPQMPEYRKNDVAGDAESLANALDDILSRVAETEEEQGNQLAADADIDAELENAYGAELEGGLRGDQGLDGVGAEGDAPGSLSDAEATEFCYQMQKKHNVVVGISWGSLPFELQEKWVVNSCDYHLAKEQ